MLTPQLVTQPPRQPSARANEPDGEPQFGVKAADEISVRTYRQRHQIFVGLLLALLLALVGFAEQSSHRRAYPTSPAAVLIGDSVMSAAAPNLISALAAERPGSIVDAKACRGTLVSCTAPGLPVAPSSGLDVIRAHRSLPPIAVVELGYNYELSASTVDTVVRELLARNVTTVIWMNLREQAQHMARSNSVLDAARARWPQLSIADWRSYSAGQNGWFSDGLHLTVAGTTEFSTFVRQSLGRSSVGAPVARVATGRRHPLIPLVIHRS